MATELGKAYVQIVPSAKGFSRRMEAMMNGSGVSAAGARAGESLGRSLVGKLKGVLVAAGIGKLITSAISAGGELEQNLGGTEAVFGKFAKTIQAQAKEAYKNMGLSASAYMATANKMGSLFQGSGMEQQKALKLTSDAMQRAADVASVMGIDMASAMESIAGAAKGNFTMMDNLGVAMNATTIQAYALEKGINFEWKTADNAQKAEVAMQMFMERTAKYAGNFARESEQTFTGSLGAMKSAFTNLLADLSTGRDIKPALSALATSFKDFISNLFPMLESLLSKLPLAIAEFISTAGPGLVAAGMDMVTNILTGIGQSLPQILPMLAEAMQNLQIAFLDSAPGLIEAGVQFIVNFAQGLVDSIPIVVEKIPIIIEKLISAVMQAIPMIMDAGVQLLSSLVQNLPQIIQSVVKAIPQIIMGIIRAITENLPKIIKAGVDLFIAIISDLPTIIVEIIKAIPQIITSIIGALIEGIPQLIMTGVDLIVSLITNLPKAIAAIVKAIPQIIKGIADALLHGVKEMANIGGQLVKGLWEGIQGLAGWLWDKVSGWASNLWKGIKGFFGIASPSKLFAWAGEMLDAGLAQGIAGNVGLVQNAMSKLENEAERTFSSDFALSFEASQKSVTAAERSGVREETDIDLLANLKALVEVIKSQGISGDVLLDGDTIVGRLVSRMDEEIAAKQERDTFGGGELVPALS